MLRHELKKFRVEKFLVSVAVENSNKALTKLDGLENNRTLSIPEANFRRILKTHLLWLLSYQKQYLLKWCNI